MGFLVRFLVKIEKLVNLSENFKFNSNSSILPEITKSCGIVTLNVVKEKLSMNMVLLWGISVMVLGGIESLER